jgi:ribosomal protein S18 acetylase RimI-like enzyme
MALVSRPASAADYPAFARLHPELGSGDPLPSPGVWLRDLVPRTWLFEQDGVAAGYLYFERLAGSGYIRHVVVAPELRGQGVGKAMMRAVADELRRTGCDRWCLNVKPENTAAVRLYAGLGMREVHRSVAFRFAWPCIDRLPPSDRFLETCPIEPEEDAAIERAFDLPAGQLAQGRARARTVVLRLRDPAAPDRLDLGFAVFVIDFPGAFPFRLADPAYAAPLLAGLRAQSNPTLPDMGIVAEADPELARRMLDVGASVKMEFCHYAGPLPELQDMS